MNFYKVGNNTPVVARLEFFVWRNMQQNLHLLDTKQMGDLQSFLNLHLQTVTSMLNQRKLLTNVRSILNILSLLTLKALS